MKIERPLHRAIKDYAIKTGYKDLIYLTIGEPDFPTPPHIINAAKKALDSGFTHYTGDRGLLELRRAISDELKKSRGLDVDPQNGILVTTGAFEAVNSVLLALINPNEEVILSDPCWPSYIAGVRLAGGKPVQVPVDMNTLEWDSEFLKQYVSGKTKAIIVNSPNNPTGGVFSKTILKEISDLIEDKNIVIISDEVYDVINYTKHQSITELDGMLEKTILINSFSKTFAMTGWRIGYLAGNPTLVPEILKVKGTLNVCPSSISQKAAIAALKGPRDAVNKMVREYGERRRILLKGLHEIPRIRCAEPKGAFYAFPNISSYDKDSVKFTKDLIHDAHVVVSPGKTFGPSGEGYIRISYACSQINLKKALERMKNSLLIKNELANED